jgi:hypothetical protein
MVLGALEAVPQAVALGKYISGIDAEMARKHVRQEKLGREVRLEVRVVASSAG